MAQTNSELTESWRTVMHTLTRHELTCKGKCSKGVVARHHCPERQTYMSILDAKEYQMMARGMTSPEL